MVPLTEELEDMVLKRGSPMGGKRDCDASNTQYMEHKNSRLTRTAKYIGKGFSKYFVCIAVIGMLPGCLVDMLGSKPSKINREANGEAEKDAKWLKREFVSVAVNYISSPEFGRRMENERRYKRFTAFSF